jgi:hypothetical protein
LFQKDAIPMTWILIKMACYINKIHCQNYIKLFLALSNSNKKMIWMHNHTKLSVVNIATAFLLIAFGVWQKPIHIYHPCWINHFIVVFQQIIYIHIVFLLRPFFKHIPSPQKICKRWFSTIKGIVKVDKLVIYVFTKSPLISSSLIMLNTKIY